MYDAVIFVDDEPEVFDVTLDVGCAAQTAGYAGNVLERLATHGRVEILPVVPQRQSLDRDARTRLVSFHTYLNFRVLLRELGSRPVRLIEPCRPSPNRTSSSIPDWLVVLPFCASFIAVLASILGALGLV